MSGKESQDRENIQVTGSGAAASHGGVAAGAGGIAIGGDVHGDVTVIHEGAKVQIPGPEAVQRHRTALREQLAVDAQGRWGGMSVYIQEEGATLPIQASPYQVGQLGPRQNLLQLLHDADRLLVLGEPGTGKTVALERLAWELCDGPAPTVPVLIRLFQYAGTPLVEWVRTFLQRTGQLRLDDERALTAFLKEGDARCVFLFDGLNEVSPPYRDYLVDELVRWMAAYPRHPVILTSRSQDELWRRVREDIGRAVVVQPISDEQARAYLVSHLGKRGASLYAQLDQRLQELARTPLILWLIKEAGAAREDIPGNRGELYGRFVKRMLQRDTERRMDAEIPVRVKQKALAGLAFDLGRGQRLSCDRDEAVEVVAERLDQDLEQAEQLIGACARHGLLAGEEEVWFAPHQTIQEHFAALALLALVEQEQRLGWLERLRRTTQRRFTGAEEGLAALAAEDWWMETFVQLAGLVDDADWLVREVARVNPWLGWWCVEEGRKVEVETREVVADRSVRMLESEQVQDRRRAVAALAQMPSGRAAGPLLRATADPDAEVADLAMQTLVRLGETARSIVAEALAGKDKRLWSGALRYLTTRLDDPLCGQVPEEAWESTLGLSMVWIPPGPFWMGSDDKDPLARDREKPKHQVTLTGYWIGRYPVTVAQFRAFVQDSGYGFDREDLREPDDHPAVYISWHDAIDYCHWLSKRSGLSVTPPSEAEWEKAARGTDGRFYPWGDQAPTNELCNFGKNVGHPTPVGQYSPQGDSPYGCADMAGNVSEWTRSLCRGYPYWADDGREEWSSAEYRVVRGGACHNSERGVRCACRSYWGLRYRFGYGGMRVVVAPVSPLDSGPSTDT